MAITERYVTRTGTDTYANSTSSGTPMSIATAVANAVAGDRINIQDDGTDYAFTSDFATTNAGTAASPILWRGYTTTIGDGNQGRNADGTLDTSNMPTLAFSGTSVDFRPGQQNQVFESMILTTATVTGTFLTPSLNNVWVNCSVAHSGAGSSTARTWFSTQHCSLIDCDIVNTCTTADATCYINANPSSVINCRVKCENASGVELAQPGAAIIGNLIYESVDGVEIGTGSTTAARGVIVGNTIVDMSGSGIKNENANHDDTLIIVGNLVTDCGAYGYDCAFATALQRLFYNNRWDRNTTADFNNVGDWPDINSETTSEATQTNEYTSPSTDDYTLASTSPAIDAGAMPSANIGYWQNAASAGGGGGGTKIAGFGGGVVG